jgi:hypothetical protein
MLRRVQLVLKVLGLRYTKTELRHFLFIWQIVIKHAENFFQDLTALCQDVTLQYRT